MKTAKTKKTRTILTFILSISMIFGTYISATASEMVPVKNNVEQARSIDPLDYPENTRERFVASLAQQNEISYEEADQLEATQSANITRAADEVLRYRTVDKSAGTISNGKGYSASPHIATEVCFVYSYATKGVVSIESLGNPYMYVPGASSFSLSSGGFNITKNAKSGRISTTGSVSYKVSGTTISIGGDIVSVSTTTGGYKVTSKAKTFVINIYESNLV